MIVLDTTILVYAVGGDHPLREPCTAVVRGVRDHGLRATTTVEVLQEFAHVRARRRGRRDAAGLTRDLATLLGPVLGVEEADLLDGMALFSEVEALGAFDAVLAAAARRHGAALASADRAFGGVPGLRHLDPASEDFLAELG